MTSLAESVASVASRAGAVGVAVGRRGGEDEFIGWGEATPGTGPPTAATVFRGYSISKPITAIAVLSVCREHGIDLDEPVGHRLDRLEVVPAAGADHPTLRQLLAHTAGVASDFEHWSVTAPKRFGELVGDRIGSLFPAGTSWAYSNGGYGVLSDWLIDVCGKPFDAVLDERVLRPAGMSHSTFADAVVTGPDVAGGFGPDGEAAPPLVPTVLGAGGLWTTVADLLSFARALAEVESFRVLVAEAAEPHQSTGVDGLDQGLGFMLRKTRRGVALWHNGAGIAGYSELYLGADGSAAALLSNTAVDLGPCAIAAFER